MVKVKHRVIWIMAVAMALLLAAAAVFTVWRKNTYTVTVSQQGDREMTLEVGSTFEDPGAVAQVRGSIFRKEPQTLPVVRTGSVDTAKTGTYEIVYTACFKQEHFLGDKQARGSSTRLVHVVDTQPPEILLDSQAGSYTLPGHAYQEEGFSAWDNYDGDLSNRVVREEKDGMVYYTVADSSGNQTQVVRQIHYDDPIFPELTLVGGAWMQMTEGEEYQDPGYLAWDNCDGDLTSQVTVAGSVNTGVPGNYTLTYTVSDGRGNTVSAQRDVTVLDRDHKPISKPKGGVIYLTFDDGPSRYTQELLDILDKYNVKATFFVVGYRDLSIVKEMAERGHAVGNHSYSHDYSRLYASKEAFFRELTRCENKLEDILGYDTKLVRFPGGSSYSKSKVPMSSLTRSLEAKGYSYFDWNVDSKDAVGAASTYEVFYNVCRGVAPREIAVVLQHDTMGYSMEAVEWIIRWGLANGYTFQSLDEDAPGMHHRTKS